MTFRPSDPQTFFTSYPPKGLAIASGLWLVDWSDLSITRKTNGNFGNVSAGVLLSTKKVIKQRILLCAFQNSQVRRDKEIFWCVQLISDWLICDIAKGIWCLISPFRVGYVNTRHERSIVNSNQIHVYEAKASRSISWDEWWTLQCDQATSLWGNQTCLNILDLCKYPKWKFLFVNTYRLYRWYFLCRIPFNFYLNHIHIFDYPNYFRGPDESG